MSDQKNPSKSSMTPIAIIGMASIFPESPNLSAYWENIISEADCIREVPESRWKVSDYYDPDPKTPDKIYQKLGGFLPEIDFNPMEFGLPPNILEVTDVSQLLALVLARDVLKDAGYGEGLKEFDRQRTGCILGVGGGQKLMHPLTQRLQFPIWNQVLESCGVVEKDRAAIIEKMKKAYVRWEENSFPGTLGNVISGRVANRFDLGSTNCVVDAACASSLAGIRMAIDDLVTGRSDLMITGGVDTDNSPYMYMCFSKTPAFTKNEVVQPFDKDSAGIMIGEGIGFLLLKRLADAERDGDKIYAVIKGVGSSSDGRFKSIYAPRSEGQLLALQRAYENAGIEPATVGLLEAHGTGTKAGDAAEVRGLKLFLGETQGSIALGSVKSQVGHTKNAAGAAGIIKAALALHHKVLPATINVKTPNPEMGLENSALYINSETRPWVKAPGAAPRRAGVSAFGFGGTNFHFVLEEYERASKRGFRMHKVAQEILFQGHSKDELIASLTPWQSKLVGSKKEINFYELCELSRNLALVPGSHRLGFVAENAKEASDLIHTALLTLNKNTGEERWSLPQGIHYFSKVEDGKVAALFAGQGSPYLNMAKDVVYNFPPLLEAYGEMDALMQEHGHTPISKIVFPEPAFTEADKQAQAAKLQQTEFAQPAIGVMSAGLFRIAKNAGFRADFTAGHSFGELTALWAAGVLNQQEYYFLAMSRGQAMKAQSGLDAGSMLAVMGEASAIEAELPAFPGVKAANYNSKKQLVVAGPTDQIKKIQEHFKAKQFSAVLLPVSAAFHTPLVSHAQEPFAKAVQSIQFKEPQIPVFSNATGQAHPKNSAAIQESLKAHILNSVRFTQEIEAMYAEGARIFVEFGPQNILSKLVANILGDKPHLAIAFNANANKPGDRQLREAFLQLKLAGLSLSNLDPFEKRQAPVWVEKTAMTVQLSGANYVSPQTKKAFADALQDGYKIEQAKAAPAPQPTPTLAQPQMTQKPATPNQDERLNQALEALERSLASFHEHQTETIRAHEQFLQNQSDYAQTFNKLIQNSGNELVLQNLLQFSSHQAETLRVHENYLSQQNDFAKAAYDLIKEQQQILAGGASSTSVNLFQNATSTAAQTPKPVLPAAPAKPVMAAPVATPAPVAPKAPAPQPVAPPVAKVAAPVAAAPVAAPAAAAPVTAGVSAASVQAALFAVVAEKTGYMVEMLEASMDLEADLGIDSIKRVEILYGIQEKLPGLPQVNPEALSALRTLGQIAEYLQGLGGKVATPTAAPAAAPVAAPTAAPAAAGVSAASVQAALFAVVAEKTGYMVEMLEASMDLEADLGIDSIKRVEILYGIQEKLPGLPQVNPEALSALRTLGQIAEYLQGLGGKVATPTAAPAAAPVAAPVAAPAAAAPVTAGVSAASVQAALFAVVAEKTGYMVEMLEASMDLEADLGIDSIKRVEILYGIQEKLPGLPQVNPEALSALRTLGQIAEYLQGLGGKVATPAAAPVAAAPTAAPAAAGVSAASVQAALFAVVAEKTGYMVEMLEASMDLEADLGIDSIKRVEILYGIQEKLPGLPQVNPEALSALRTLGQIAEYLQGLGGQTSAAPSEAKKKTFKSELAGWRSEVKLVRLSEPARLQVTPAPGHIALVTCEGSRLTDDVSRVLLLQGFEKVLILRFPQGSVQNHTESGEHFPVLEIPNFSEAALEETLQKARQHGPIGALVHLQEVVEPKSFQYFSSNEQSILEAVFLMAKHLQPDLNLAGTKGLSVFFTLSRMDGQLGLSGAYPLSVIQGGLAGLTKTLKVEWPKVHCRHLDAEPSLEAHDLAQRLGAEVLDADRRILEIGLSQSGRFTLRAVHVNAEQHLSPAQISKEDLFLVSGGAKGVTAQCAIALAKQYQPRFVLIGRSELAAEPAWAQGLSDSAELKKAAMEHLKAQGEKPTPALVDGLIWPVLSNREIEATLQALRAAGSEVTYHAGDLNDPKAAKASLTPVLAELGTVTGIIHGAGVLADKLIEKKTPEDFRKVFNTKIRGIFSLLSCIQPNSLKHLMLFSSAAGFYGNQGQADYAAANEVLNKLAHAFKRDFSQCSVKSFNWGPWDGGMVTPQLKKHFESKGVKVIPIAVGAEILVQEASPDLDLVNQIVVGSSMVTPEPPGAERKTQILEKHLRLDSNPWLKDHSIGQEAVLPLVHALSWMLEAALSLYPGYFVQSLAKMAVLKGVILNAEAAEKYFIEVKETQASQEGLSLAVRVFSEARAHYSCQIELSLNRPATQVIAFNANEVQPMPGAEFYKNRTLFHGPSFQMIQTLLNRQGNRLTLACESHEPDEQEGFDFTLFNPFSDDGSLQALLIEARHRENAGSLPLGIAEARFGAPTPFEQPFYITLETHSCSPSKLVATAWVHDEAGQVYSEFKDAEVFISKNLDGKF